MQGVVEAKMPGNAPKPLYGQRGCAAGIASLGWFALGVQFYFDVEEAAVKGLSVLGQIIRFFSYFTIETNFLVALALTIFCTRPDVDQFLTRPRLKSALVVYIIVVGAVYALLLRHLWHPQGLQLLADIVLHDALPLLYPLYWLMFVPKGSLRWADPAWWLAFPVLFFVYSMLRGAAYGVYPYPFIDAAQLGFMRVFMNATVLLAVFFVLGVVLTAIDRAFQAEQRGRSGLGRAAEL